MAHTRIVSLFFCLATLSILIQSYSAGSPAGYTGSPIDNKSCAFSSCHGGKETKSNWINTTIPSTGFKSDSVYKISLNPIHLGATKFGFTLATQDLFGNQVGELTAGSGSQLIGGGEYITHTQTSVNSNDSLIWEFNWRAPAIGVDSVTFYAAFNAANGNGSKTGDTIYVSVLTAYSDALLNAVNAEVAINLDEIIYSSFNNTLRVKSNQDFDVQLFDINGKFVQQNQSVSSLSFSHVQFGIYFVQIEIHNQKYIKKILISG